MTPGVSILPWVSEEHSNGIEPLRLALEIFHYVEKAIVNVRLVHKTNLDLVQIAKRILMRLSVRSASERDAIKERKRCLQCELRMPRLRRGTRCARENRSKKSKEKRVRTFRMGCCPCARAATFPGIGPPEPLNIMGCPGGPAGCCIYARGVPSPCCI